MAHVLRVGIRIAAVLAAMVAAGVIAAWLAGVPAVVHGLPDWPRTNVDSAIWLLFASLGLLATTLRGIRPVARVLGGILVVLVAAAIAGYAISAPTYSSRAAFLFAGIGLAIHRKPLGVIRAVLVGMCGVLVAAVAAVTILGHAPTLTGGLPWLSASMLM